MNKLILVALAVLVIYNVNNLSVAISKKEADILSIPPIIFMAIFATLLDVKEYPRLGLLLKILVGIIITVIILVKIKNS